MPEPSNGCQRSSGTAGKCWAGSREMRDKQKGAGQALGTRKQHSCRLGTGTGLGSLQAASPRAAPPLSLPCPAEPPLHLSPGIDGRAGRCRCGDVTLREPRSSLLADKGERRSILVSGHQQPTELLPPAPHPGQAQRALRVQRSTGRMRMGEPGLARREGESCVGVEAQRGSGVRGGLAWREGESCVGVKAQRGSGVRGGPAGAEREVSAVQERTKHNDACCAQGAGDAGCGTGKGWRGAGEPLAPGWIVRDAGAAVRCRGGAGTGMSEEP